MPSSVHDLSHYERLGVTKDADPELLRQAFRRLSKSVHPDTTRLPKDVAARQFHLLREAYKQLADPRLRRLYDAALEERTANSVSPAPPPMRSVNAVPCPEENGRHSFCSQERCCSVSSWGSVWPGIGGWRFRFSRVG